mmetsp:Transcript_8469/g.21648  ORF Transcript_8469/g.21648 Transcript_8469/m.21648 type:complete len:270 (+) Transcript_8469:248-1057(+)
MILATTGSPPSSTAAFGEAGVEPFPEPSPSAFAYPPGADVDEEAPAFPDALPSARAPGGSLEGRCDEDDGGGCAWPGRSSDPGALDRLLFPASPPSAAAPPALLRASRFENPAPSDFDLWGSGGGSSRVAPGCPPGTAVADLLGERRDALEGESPPEVPDEALPARGRPLSPAAEAAPALAVVLALGRPKVCGPAVEVLCVLLPALGDLTKQCTGSCQASSSQDAQASGTSRFPWDNRLPLAKRFTKAGGGLEATGGALPTRLTVRRTQ